MDTVEDLIRIKQANDILNRGFQKVGAKPIYVDSSINEFQQRTKKNPIVQFNFKPQIDLINEISSKLKHEKENKKNKNSQTSNKISILIVFVLVAVLIYTCFYVYNPQKLLSNIKTTTQKILVKNTDQEARSETSEAKSITSLERSFVITSGIFKNKSEAEKYQSKLKNKLGIPLKLIKVEKFYAVQLGPEYKVQDDVMLVFDELSRYEIKNLSIRISG